MSYCVMENGKYNSEGNLEKVIEILKVLEGLPANQVEKILQMSKVVLSTYQEEVSCVGLSNKVHKIFEEREANLGLLS